MTDLAELSRDEWADKPYLIELQGGPGAGQRFQWHQLPAMWRQPLQAPPAPISTFLQAAPTMTAESAAWVADYRHTGSVTDDGAHVYAFDQFE